MEGKRRVPERRELWWVLGYFALYMLYNFVAGGENETAHWLTLVAIPLAMVAFLRQEQVKAQWPPDRRASDEDVRARPDRQGARAGWNGTASETLASIGLRKGNLRTGVGWAIIIGLGISVLQSLGRIDEIAELVLSGKVLYLYPLVLALLFFTAGFTEEVFFRGVLQTRLHRATGSATLGILVTAVLFSVHHLPYAYLKWSSAGDWGSAFQASFANGMLGGIVLGFIYVRAKQNLLATIIVHTLINSVPAMTMVKFGG